MPREIREVGRSRLAQAGCLDLQGRCPDLSQLLDQRAVPGQAGRLLGPAGAGLNPGDRDPADLT